MTNIENLKNWIEVLECSNKFLSKIKEYLNTNLDENFKYDLYENVVDFSDYSLINAVILSITNENDTKYKMVFAIDIKNLPDFYEDVNEDIDNSGLEYQVRKLSNEQKEEILKKYDDAFSEFIELDLKQRSNEMQEYAKNGFVFLSSDIAFEDRNIVLYVDSINNARMILKDDVLYFVKDENDKNKVAVYDEEYLKQLDHIDLKELSINNTFILPRRSGFKKESDDLVYSVISDRININAKDKKFNLVNFSKLDECVFDAKALTNPNYKDEYIKYYLNNINKTNKAIIKEINKQKTTTPYDSFDKKYLSLDADSFLDAVKLLNWRRAISLREWQLEKSGIKHVTDKLGNKPIDSFNDKQKKLIAKYKYLADTCYKEIDYQAIFSELKDEKIDRRDDTNAYPQKIIIKLKEEKKEKNKTR